MASPLWGGRPGVSWRRCWELTIPSDCTKKCQQTFLVPLPGMALGVKDFYWCINMALWIKGSYCLYWLILSIVFSYLDENRVVYDWFLLADKLCWKSREAREKGPTSRHPSSALVVAKRASFPGTSNNNRTRGWEDHPRLFHPLHCQCGDWTERWCWGCEFWD